MMRPYFGPVTACILGMTLVLATPLAASAKPAFGFRVDTPKFDMAPADEARLPFMPPVHRDASRRMGRHASMMSELVVQRVDPSLLRVYLCRAGLSAWTRWGLFCPSAMELKVSTD